MEKIRPGPNSESVPLPTVFPAIEALLGLGKRFRRADVHPQAVELNGGKAASRLRFIPKPQDREGPRGGVTEQARVIDGDAGEHEGDGLATLAAMWAAII